MDEVDIDNVEDLNELEARLYGQIHHEATNEANTENNNGLVFDAINKDTLEQNYETSSNTNEILSRRYWANAKTSAKIPQHNSKQRFIRNPFKTPNQQEDRQIKLPFSNKSPIQQTKQQQKSKQSKNQSNASLISSKTNEQAKSTQRNSNLQTEKTTPSTMKTTISSDTEIISQSVVTLSSSNENKITKYSKSEQSSAKQKVPAEKTNLKLNPVANWMERKKNQNKNVKSTNNNVNGKNSKNFTTTNSKQGPFARQQEKLQKVKRIEEKKQKSKKAKNTAAAIASKIKAYEIIDLETENESDSSDVIVIPIAPPTTYTVDDSDEEKDKVAIVLGHEENALDSTDVQMSSTSGSFIKPQSIQNAEGSENRLENSSRCTSPCSIQSSDDFIGQTDRSRLLVGASDMADDEDLLVLTTDINSLLGVPEVLKQIVHDDADMCVEKEEISLEQSVDQVPGENMKNNDSLEFVTPETSTAQSQKHDYRVDQGLFRALDVYESESDITDSVYSKGVNKATVIRQIDTSSDEIEVISSSTQRTKRLRKRRASSGNKESDPNNENLVSSSDNEDDDRDAFDDNKVLRTPIPFIAKGPAVECYKPRKRSQTLHSCSPQTLKHKLVKTPITSGNMSDTKFITTLNNLAQGQEGEQLEQDEGEESEIENVPTARDIAEKILAQHNVTEETKKSSTEDMAIPEALLDELDKVFETIDHMDEQETNQHGLSSREDTVKISDSDSDREKHFIYKSLPNEEAQIIKYSPPTSKTQEKVHNKNCSPIYNVIYSRGQRKPGGMGWNDEMRKFYNESWNGEYFSMNKILQKMNPDRNLWKIYTEDRFSIKLNKRSNFKCTNCCEFGHIRSRCKKPRKPLICYMCGDSGHHEPRCPNTICLRCGKKTQVFTKSCNVCSFQNRLICPICKIRGHSLDYCPDKWRRYHSTTEANTYPNSNVVYNPRKYCCICGARGHLSDNCRSAVRFLEYPPTVSTIKSHQKSYSDVVVKTPHNGIALNLMYEPCQEYKFCLVEKTSSNKYYGRFLKAVGLDYLLKRKRHISAVASEVSDTTAKKTKRLSKKYEANPYSKIGAANQKNIEAEENAPNQVQEITESGSTDQQDIERDMEEDVINIEDNDNDTAGSGKEIELIGSTVGDDDVNIQLNTIVEKTAAAKHHDENFKPPENVKSTTSLKSQTEPPVMLDSDSNYSFSEHFDVASTSGELPLPSTGTPNVEQQVRKTPESTSSRPKPREMEALPDFIPLINSSEEQNQQNSDNEYPDIGISRRFVATISEYDEDEEMERNRTNLSPLPELPCEAKIYLTHLHSIYLLSPVGNTFLVKTSRAHKLKARLDFTSIGHVLVIFGLPRNQDNFQRELLLKYRELEDESNQKHVQSHFNVPKRIDVLIRFLRENINLLLSNLGNVNHLLKRLQFLERQQSKSGFKLAEKVRRSLNMILVGQAGLQDGSMHLDKLLVSLKTLINDYNSKDFTPPELRSEITDHWKVIFSAYRHENYQRLVEAYNRLISKNRMPKLVIDPILLGQKALDVSLSEEQKQKLEQARTIAASTNPAYNCTDAAKQIVPNPLNQKNTKPLKRKQNAGATETRSPSSSTAQDSAKAKTPTSRSHTPTKTLQTETLSTRAEKSTSLSNVKTKSTINNTPSALNSNKTSTNTGTTAKTKTISTIIHTANKSKQSISTTNTTSKTPTAANANFNKKEPQKLMPPPPFANPEQRSKVSTTIQKGTDEWKSTCDTLLTEISCDKKVLGSGKVRDSKLPSTFWSREAMRYLHECLRLAAAQPSVVEKLKRVENKSKRGQLSYNDYLAVIKLHTALNQK